MKTILLIEDNISLLENLTEYLELEGYNILVANNGRKGIELARQFIPDLIICDILMPDMNGFEVLHTLLNNTKIAEIPFMFSTSMSEKINKTEGLELGADDYIIKPFALETLLNMIEDRIKYGSKRRKCVFEKLQFNPFKLQFIYSPAIMKVCNT